MYEALTALLLLALILAWLIFWLLQFVQVMLLADADFPGRYDKPLWVAVFVLVFLLAPFAFLLWKRAYLAMRRQQ